MNKMPKSLAYLANIRRRSAGRQYWPDKSKVNRPIVTLNRPIYKDADWAIGPVNSGTCS